MFVCGLVVIACLVCGTILLLNGAGVWTMVWPIGMSVFFAILAAAHVGVRVPSKPWPKREE